MPHDFEYGHILEKLGVLAIAVFSGFLFQYGHGLLHAFLGIDTVAVVFVSIGIGVLSGLEYFAWTELTDLEFSEGILAITAAAGWILHYASHAVEGLTAVAVVGEYMFWVGPVGALLNYFLTEDGVWLFGEKY